ncbi:MAG: hypothetical protein ACE5KH_04345, partial [Candidatus Geothermarchaeales archaeon]
KRREVHKRNVDDVGIDTKMVGIHGSPTKVHRSLVRLTTGARKCRFVGEDLSLQDLVDRLIEDGTIE